MSELEYKINDYISLKLEDYKTYIYIKGEKFLNCIRLVLQIPKKTIEDFDEINSIDEASKLYKTLYQNTIMEDFDTHDITAEQEFWGHCSNIEAWCENEYDTRLIHSNIAFPLLKKLAEAGDPTANKVYKSEIAVRIGAEYLPVAIYLINNFYFLIFNDEEMESIKEIFMERIDKLDKNYYSSLEISELNDLGRALNEFEEYEKAIEILNMALKRNPKYPYALNNLGLSYFYQKDYETAKEYYIKATEADPNDNLAFSNLSEVYDIFGDFDNSMHFAYLALKIKPTNYEALFFFGHANFKKGNYEIAIGNYKEALDVEEEAKIPYGLEDHRVWAHLGEAYLKNGDYKEAQKACEKSLTLKPNQLHAKNLQRRINKSGKK